MVIGFSGKIGSGKSTISLLIAKDFNCKYTSFGNYVRKVALSRNLSPTRENLQDLGQQLLTSNMSRFCEAILEEVKWRKGESLIIDGIRHVEVINEIKSIVKPDIFKLVFLKIEDDEIRQFRIGYQLDRLIKTDNHPTEKQLKEHKLSEEADLIIDAEKNSISTQRSIICDWASKYGMENE